MSSLSSTFLKTGKTTYSVMFLRYLLLSSHIDVTWITVLDLWPHKPFKLFVIERVPLFSFCLLFPSRLNNGWHRRYPFRNWRFWCLYHLPYAMLCFEKKRIRYAEGMISITGCYFLAWVAICKTPFIQQCFSDVPSLYFSRNSDFLFIDSLLLVTNS